MICWNCKHYIRSKPILFGLGQTADKCKIKDPDGYLANRTVTSCSFYKKDFWKSFWDRATREV